MFGSYFRNFEKHNRLFERGDLKYVILDLIKDKPIHGYEIIREMEKRFHGFYTPSAGSVYPTLQLLEDLGYVKSAEQDGKKVYTITEEGRKFLFEREETMDKIRENMRGWWGREDKDDFRETMEDLRDLGKKLVQEFKENNPDKMRQIKEILQKAARDIDEVIRK
jgi:DNA-binding PadR family transcriptional regulator